MGIFDSIKNALGKGEDETEEPLAESPAIEPGSESPGIADEGGRPASYEVRSGDTLWKIAETVYGHGSHYMAIFEANSDLLESPDHIFPGQNLKIPELTAN